MHGVGKTYSKYFTPQKFKFEVMAVNYKEFFTKTLCDERHINFHEKSGISSFFPCKSAIFGFAHFVYKSSENAI